MPGRGAGESGASRGASERSPGELGQPAEELRDGLTDLCRRVLLDKVATSHGDLLLVTPRAAELALSAYQDDARIRVDKELGQARVGQPAAVALNDLGHVGGLAVDGDLSRPREGGSAGLTRLR